MRSPMMSRVLSPARMALMAPFWAAQLATGAKSFTDNPILGSRALNARGLHARRAGLAHRMAQRRRDRLAHLVSAEDRAAFEADGFVLRRDFLPAELFARLVEQVKALRTTAREMQQGNAVTRRINLAPGVVSRSPALGEVLRGAEWRGLLRYAGSYDAEPICYLQSILSHSMTGPDDPQCMLHADTFHPTMKAWLFLTDVPEDEGPFTYVPGSHRMTPARAEWEYRRSVAIQEDPDRLSQRGSFRVGEEDLAVMGLPQARAFAVPANTLVVADTCGFHARGPSVRPTLRVELWAYGRRNPFLPWTGLDPWALGSLGSVRPELGYLVGDLEQRLTGKIPLWRRHLDTTAFDPTVAIPQ